MQASKITTKNLNQPSQYEHCTFIVSAPRFVFVFNSYRKSLTTKLVSSKILELLTKEKSHWKGIDINFTGKVGIFIALPLGSGILKSKTKEYYDTSLIKEYEINAKSLLDIIIQYNTLEDVKLSNKYSYPLIKFRAVNEEEMISEDVPLITYTRPVIGDTTLLLYKMTRSDPEVVRIILETAGFRYTDKHNWNILWTNNHAKGYLFKGLNEYQRINHFPGSIEITRKDRMKENIVQRQQKYGKAYFDIIPETFILPDEIAMFYEKFYEYKERDNHNLWILKPNALSRGRGIHIITDPSNVPIDEPCIISKYIHNPLLINSLKFDIRLYVLLTSVDPLRFYVYNEGLARFCTEKYNLNMKDNRYVHLTNYSINKRSEKFVQNNNAEEDNVGQKWSLTALNRYLEANSVDTSQLWTRIYDLIIRTMIACEPSLFLAYKKKAVHRGNCFELFGFDVLLDEELRPWLIEVNLSPSLVCESPLDQQIKSNLVADMFTLIGIRQFDRRKDGVFKTKVPQGALSFNSKKRMTIRDHLSDNIKQREVNKKLGQLNRKQREILIETIEEYERRRGFIRLYPSKGVDYYDNLFEVTRNNHKIVYKFLYGESDISPSVPVTSLKSPKLSINVQQKVLITGDDILIEYVERLTLALKSLKEAALKPAWVRAIENFITHDIWKTNTRKALLWQNLEEKLNDMKERRNKLFSLDNDSHLTQTRKRHIVQQFSVSQLEEMLRSSTRDAPCAIVSCLISNMSPGVLQNIVTWMSRYKEESAREQIYRVENIDNGYKKKSHLTPIKSTTVISDKSKFLDNALSKSFLQSASKLSCSESIINRKNKVYRFTLKGSQEVPE